jgi:hypothetical protein
MKKYSVSPEVEFSYREIQGTALNAEDDWHTTISTPFPIHFGGSGSSFERLTIDSNGALSFTDLRPLGYFNQEFPVENTASLIAPLWDDLNPGPKGDIYYETLGEAPGREFVVEWRNVNHYDSTGDATFQVVFFENSSDILFSYLDLDFNFPGANNGADATIGIQSSYERSTLVTYNTAQINSRTTLKFSVER